MLPPTAVNPGNWGNPADVRSVASVFGGGGHKNASGFTVTEPLDQVRPRIIQLIVDAIERGLRSRPQ